jgi:hypothetical protein
VANKELILQQLSQVIERENELLMEKKKFTELWRQGLWNTSITRPFTSPSTPLQSGRGVFALMDPKGKETLLRWVNGPSRDESDVAESESEGDDSGLSQVF